MTQDPGSCEDFNRCCGSPPRTRSQWLERRLLLGVGKFRNHFQKKTKTFAYLIYQRAHLQVFWPPNLGSAMKEVLELAGFKPLEQGLVDFHTPEAKSKAGSLGLSSSE